VFGSTDVTGPPPHNWRVEWESEGGAVSEAEAVHAEAEVFDRPGAMRLELAWFKPWEQYPLWMMWWYAQQAALAQPAQPVKPAAQPVPSVQTEPVPVFKHMTPLPPGGSGGSGGSGWSTKGSSFH
jgi:hypothetical protein